MKTISTYTHGILDYIIGIILILAPNIFGFESLGGPAVSVARTIGVLVIVQALITKYELGLFPILSMRLHLFGDYVMSVILAASPWIWSFYGRPNHVWLPHLIIGCVYFVITSMTRTAPRIV